MHGDDKLLGGQGKRRRSIGRELKMIMCICMIICQSLAGRFLLYSTYVYSNDLNPQSGNLWTSLIFQVSIQRAVATHLPMGEGKILKKRAGTIESP